MQLSKYQEEILNYFSENKQKNIGVSAFAGTGKTFIIERMTEISDTRDIYLAFNNTIAEEFKTKIKNPKTSVMTVHALAYSIMNYNLSKSCSSHGKGGAVGVIRESPNRVSASLDNLKVYKIIDDFLDATDASFKEKTFLRNSFYELYNKCRVTLTNFEDTNGLLKLIDEYNLFDSTFYGPECEMPTIKSIASWLKKIDEISLKEFSKNKSIDFTDMLYITYLKLKSGEWKPSDKQIYYNVYLDEAQDNNKLQINFLKYVKHIDGRYIFVYDKKQSCYLFNGADAYALDEIEKLYSPIENFTLPVNYRCPTSHLKLVNDEFGIPIEPRKDAPKGKIVTIKKNDIYKYVKPGDMVVSRKNKWLSDVVTELTMHNIPIFIHDKDMVSQVKRIVKYKKSSDLTILCKQLRKDIKNYREFIQNQVSALAKNNGMTEAMIKLENTSSQMDCTYFLLDLVENFIKEYHNIGIRDFSTYLDKVLSVTPSPKAVMLSSVHKAKGLEAENVFVLNEGKVCEDERNSPEQDQQEKNLRYISITRAKNTLFFVKEDEKNV